MNERGNSRRERNRTGRDITQRPVPPPAETPSPEAQDPFPTIGSYTAPRANIARVPFDATDPKAIAAHFPEKKSTEPAEPDWLKDSVTQLSDEEYGLSSRGIASSLGVTRWEIEKTRRALIAEGRITRRDFKKPSTTHPMKDPAEKINALLADRPQSGEPVIEKPTTRPQTLEPVEEFKGPAFLMKDTTMMPDLESAWGSGIQSPRDLVDELGITLSEAREIARWMKYREEEK